MHVLRAWSPEGPSDRLRLGGGAELVLPLSTDADLRRGVETPSQQGCVKRLRINQVGELRRQLRQWRGKELAGGAGTGQGGDEFSWIQTGVRARRARRCWSGPGREATSHPRCSASGNLSRGAQEHECANVYCFGHCEHMLAFTTYQYVANACRSFEIPLLHFHVIVIWRSSSGEIVSCTCASILAPSSTGTR